MTDAPKLAPCPFCGGTSHVAPWPPYHLVICENCGAEGPTAKTARQAKKLWNTRAALEGNQ